MIHQREPRQRDDEYLALVRSCCCIGCDQDPAGEAAHLRMSNFATGKPITGIGIKPNDEFALPLCRSCHKQQHAIGERKFWHALGIDAAALAVRLVAAREDLQLMRAHCFRAREGWR